VVELTVEHVRAVIGQHQQHIQLCYEQALAQDPKLAGRIAVALTIDENGAVLAADAPKKKNGKPGRKREDAILDPAVVGCVEKVFLGLKFPASQRGLVQLEYAVVFATQTAPVKDTPKAPPGPAPKGGASSRKPRR
jgi:hypothetical protein